MTKGCEPSATRAFMDHYAHLSHLEAEKMASGDTTPFTGESP